MALNHRYIHPVRITTAGKRTPVPANCWGPWQMSYFSHTVATQRRGPPRWKSDHIEVLHLIQVLGCKNCWVFSGFKLGVCKPRTWMKFLHSHNKFFFLKLRYNTSRFMTVLFIICTSWCLIYWETLDDSVPRMIFTRLMGQARKRKSLWRNVLCGSSAELPYVSKPNILLIVCGQRNDEKINLGSWSSEQKIILFILFTIYKLYSKYFENR